MKRQKLMPPENSFIAMKPTAPTTKGMTDTANTAAATTKKDTVDMDAAATMRNTKSRAAVIITREADAAAAMKRDKEKEKNGKRGLQ